MSCGKHINTCQRYRTSATLPLSASAWPFHNSISCPHTPTKRNKSAHISLVVKYVRCRKPYKSRKLYYVNVFSKIVGLSVSWSYQPWRLCVFRSGPGIIKCSIRLDMRHLLSPSATLQTCLRYNEQSGCDGIRENLLCPCHECRAKYRNTFTHMVHNKIYFERITWLTKETYIFDIAYLHNWLNTYSWHAKRII